MLLWLQHAWSTDLPVAVSRGFENIDVNTNLFETHHLHEFRAARGWSTLTTPLARHNPITVEQALFEKEILCIYIYERSVYPTPYVKNQRLPRARF